MSNSDEIITVGANIPLGQAELLDCIVMANTHRSKSDIIREALKYYILEKLDPEVLKGAKEIQKLRNKTLRHLDKKSD